MAASGVLCCILVLFYCIIIYLEGFLGLATSRCCMRHADLGIVLVTQIADKLIWRLYIHGIITVYERLSFTVGICFSLPII